MNGVDATSPQGALEAYASMRDADRITVSITRRGQELTLEYTVEE